MLLLAWQYECEKKKKMLNKNKFVCPPKNENVPQNFLLRGQIVPKWSNPNSNPSHPHMSRNAIIWNFGVTVLYVIFN